MRTSNAHDAAVFAVAAACRAGDTATLRTLLAADVIAVVDGEGQRTGVDSVGGLLVDAATGELETSVSVEAVNGQSGLAYRRVGRVVGVVALSVEYGVIDRVWIVFSPHKLRHWVRGPSDVEHPSQ